MTDKTKLLIALYVICGFLMAGMTLKGNGKTERERRVDFLSSLVLGALWPVMILLKAGWILGKRWRPTR